jgi:hypothetical protein
LVLLGKEKLMKVAIGTALAVTSTVLLTVFAIASALATPRSFDSRDILILAIGAAGVVLASLAFRELRAISRQLSQASA